MDAPVTVAYDGSAESDLAVAWAARYAGSAGLPVRAVVVVPPDDWAAGFRQDWGEDYIERLVERAETGLREALVGEARPAEAGAADPVVEIHHGPVVSTLLAMDAALLVLGSLGHGQLAGAFLGSVSQALARRATCPVVVIRAPADAAAKRVVVGVDGSEHSERALGFAIDVAEALGVPVAVRHGWRLTNVPIDMRGEVAPGLVARIEEEQRVPAEMVERARAAHPEVEMEVDSVPVAAAHLLSDASRSAALVVVGSRGRGAVEGMLFGSVSQDVLHRAQCPVAVVP